MSIVFECLSMVIHCARLRLLILSHHRGCMYICSIRHCGALIVQADRRGATSLPVCFTSAHAGVFRWVWAAAVGLRAAACMVVAGATDGCAVGAVGAFTAAVGTADLAAADGVLAGCSATSTLGCVSGLTASG